MIATVSTVKMSLAGVQRFVEGNLAGGADHLVLFLDSPQPELQEWLSEQEAVTFLVTNKRWWQAGRPQLLNKRQRVNANVARSVMTLMPSVDWLFHVDADEVVQIDREQLDAVPADRPAVNLRPLEVVSERHVDGEPTRFKRLLKDEELQLLSVLGVLDEPTNSLYFRSHIAGKVGVRPSLDLWLGIHKAETREVDRVPLVRRPGLRMLHFESYSGDEFIRKWVAMVGSGPSINFGTHRQKLADAMKTLLAMDLPADRTEHYLGMIYDRYMADPVDLLDGLGLIEHVDARAGGHRPTPLPAAERDLLRDSLAALGGARMKQFLPDDPTADAAAVMRERLGVVPEPRPVPRVDVPETSDAPDGSAPAASGGEAERGLLGRLRRR